jgi:hypothetical protein
MYEGLEQQEKVTFSYAVLELWILNRRKRRPFPCAVLELRILRVLSRRRNH